MTNRRVTNAPLSVQVHLTRRCNLNCYYCGALAFKNKEKEPELSTEEWINLIKRLKDIQVFYLDISGGEIFLREDIFKILETTVYCKFPSLELTTNCTLISNSIVKELKSLDFNNISVSLDGTKDIHDRIRGEGSFNKIIEGCGHFVNNGILPTIRFTPIKDNYKSLLELVDILYSLGLKKIVLNQLKATGGCTKIYKDIMLDTFVDTVEMQEIIENIKLKYSDFNIGSANSFLFYKNLPAQYYKNKSSLKSCAVQKLSPCSAAYTSCNITSSGWVIPCSEMFDFKGGNIRDKDILDIWRNSENFKEIRNLANVSMDNIPYCRNCDYKVICSAGCRADAYAVYNDLMAPDPFCPYWKYK